MACFINWDFRVNYPDTFVAKFISSTDVNSPFSPSHIDDTHDGYYAELAACGQAATTPGSHSLIPTPYPTRLRPLTDLTKIFKADRVFIDKIEVFGYDTTNADYTSGDDPVQDADTLTAIYNSKSTNDAYPQSMYRNGMHMNWQPNYCNPAFYIDNGKNLLDFTHQADPVFGSPKADSSIGYPVPYCFDLQRELGKIKDIRAYGQIAQKVGTKYQRYVLLMLVTFWLGKSNISQ